MTTWLIPQPDPSPLPGSAWLFHALLLFTFFVHVLFMNASLGAGLIGGVHGLTGKSARQRIARRALAAILPAGVSFTVTTGVAPLLFVQVLYGQVFYPATILIGWAWLAVPVLVLTGYAAVYALKRTSPSGGGSGWLGVIALGFLAVATIQVTANVLQLTPGRWVGVATGRASALAEATLLPRLLHFVVGSLAVGGMALAFWAARRSGEEESGWLGRAGVRWALAATAVQMAGGFWFLFSLPTDIQKALVLGRGTPTVLLAVAMCLGFLTLMLLARLEDPVAQRALLHGAAASLVLTLLGMVMLRDAVRDLYLQSVLQPETLPVRAQPDLMLLFAVVLLLGLATLAWLGRRILHDRAAAVSTAPRP